MVCPIERFLLLQNVLRVAAWDVQVVVSRHVDTPKGSRDIDVKHYSTEELKRYTDLQRETI